MNYQTHSRVASSTSSVERPAAISGQNCRRSAFRATDGLPGERNASRPAWYERRRLTFAIATTSFEVLRRLLESTLDPAVAVMNQSIGRCFLALPDRPADRIPRPPRSPPTPAAHCSFESHLAHEASDRAARAPDAFPVQLTPDLPDAIELEALGPHVPGPISSRSSSSRWARAERSVGSRSWALHA